VEKHTAVWVSEARMGRTNASNGYLLGGRRMDDTVPLHQFLL